MSRANQQRILRELLRLPTAPFAEHRVIDYLRAFCRARPPLRLRQDRAGNLLIHLRRGMRRIKRPVCLAAHLDHPGFVAEKLMGPRRVRARWRGGVLPSFFRGARVRFFTDGGWVRGRIRSFRTRGSGTAQRVTTADVQVVGTVPTGAVGMWDLPDPQLRHGRIYARACDDLAGVAAILCAADELAVSRAAAEAYFLLTRGEEVGFAGALAACRMKTVPARCVVVAVETSAERPTTRMGHGPVLRVGDRVSVFTHAATAWCGAVAERCARQYQPFKYQRALMDGGACESSAYCQMGYDATGVCLALGNYHNMNRRRGVIASECVDAADFRNLVRWFVQMARAPIPYVGRDTALIERLNKLDRAHADLLIRTRRA